jgi:ribosome-associated protein
MNLEESIVEALGKVKAYDIISIDTKEKSPFYDEMVVASVSSMRQVSAVITYITEEVEKNGFKVRAVEGKETPWVIVDCYDIIVLIFTEEERKRVSIEKIYTDTISKQL